ncbi:ABC transporter substrate-binding protein [Solidesulfovibrio sp. C21]|uniref:ABC transporter substrate-binding protein n=1 Tax=Solidesulfovibrio sp. C21 TaxID=3398613 RepID=UPI0039FC594F
MKSCRRLFLGVLLACCVAWLFPPQAAAEPPEAQPSPRYPARIVTLAPSLTEIVYALDRGELLVGASTYSDFPAVAKSLPRVGSYARPDLERIVALRPDCCLAVAGMTPPEAISRLQDLGVAVHVLDTASLEAVLASILKIGRLLDASDRAASLVGDMRQTIERVARERDNGPRPAVLYQIGFAPMHAACRGTFINELLELAGGRNVCAAMQGYPQLTNEQAVAFRPEVILIPTMGTDAFDAAKAQWNAWPEVPAVRQGRIFFLDSDLFDRPGPRLTQGLEELVRLLRQPPTPAAGKQP